MDKYIFRRHLEEGEKILFAVHKHWIGMVKASIEVVVFGLVLPWLLYFIGFNTPSFFWVAVVWSLIAFIRFIYIVIDWYSDTWLITNMSVITIEWHGIFRSNTARIGFEDIEGASYEIRGFWGTILRFGDMTLRVMSGSHADLKSVARPKRAELALARYQEQYLNDRNMQDTSSLKNLLSNLVAHHNRSK